MGPTNEAGEIFMRLVKTITSGDGTRRLDFHQRDDDHFSFMEFKAISDVRSPGGWTPAWPSPLPICDTLETAEREAALRIPWLPEQALDGGL
jgi:hypothetical protein